MEQVKVSIIIPIYNVASYIVDCLQSVLLQTYPAIEVILVNDDTPDDSMEQAAILINKLQEHYEVKVLSHAHNQGLSAARNTGIKAATSEWIYFLDSDDEIIPECIELLVVQLGKHPDVDFVIGGVKIVGADWNYPLTCSSYVKGNENVLRDYVANKWYMMSVNHLYKKEYLLANNLFFQDGLLHEDELFSFKLATTAQSISTVYENTYIYKVRSTGSIMSQRKLRNFEDMLFINREKYAYILKQYQSKNYVISYTYGLDCLYSYTLSLVANTFVGRNDKIRLLSESRRAFEPLLPYKTYWLGLKHELLMLLFKMPVRLILLLVKLRA